MSEIDPPLFDTNSFGDFVSQFITSCNVKPELTDLCLTSSDISFHFSDEEKKGLAQEFAIHSLQGLSIAKMAARKYSYIIISPTLALSRKDILERFSSPLEVAVPKKLSDWLIISAKDQLEDSLLKYQYRVNRKLAFEPRVGIGSARDYLELAETIQTKTPLATSIFGLKQGYRTIPVITATKLAEQKKVVIENDKTAIDAIRVLSDDNRQISFGRYAVAPLIFPTKITGINS